MAVVALWWWPLSAWLSPAAAWFVFFNAVVGAIAAMSCSASAHQADSGAAARRGLCRSGSSMVLDRLRSFSIFAAHPVAGGFVTGTPIGDDASAAAADSHFYCYGTREAEEVRATEQPKRGPQAVAATTGGTATSSAAPPSEPVALAPAEEDHAAPAPAPGNEEDKAGAEAEEQDESISLDEAYALAQRLRAQERASPPSQPPASATAATTATATATAPARTKKPVKVAEGISRRRMEAGETLEGKAELNARAELFIRQFREELKLQRLNSILSQTHALRSPTAAR